MDATKTKKAFQNLECHQNKFHSLEWDIDKDAKFEISDQNGL